MTIPDILEQESLRQAEFPVTKKEVFLAHAAVSPLPHRVTKAIADYAHQAETGDQEVVIAAQELITRTRQLAAGLMGVQAAETALVGPTSLALSFVAQGLPLKAGDEVVAYFDDYPSNVYPWTQLQEKGVVVRFVQTEELGLINPEHVLDAITANTRLVALASCHFVSGYRTDLDAIGEALHAKDILFCVDGIQTLGAFPTSLRHVDFLAADAHKWLLGPCAAGVFFVRKKVQETLRPVVHGWHNVVCPDFVARQELTFRPDARRYEAGSQNLFGLVGLAAAIELITEVGVDQIGAELFRKRCWLAKEIGERGWSVLQPDLGPQQSGGILSFYRPGRDMAQLNRQLADAAIVTSLRTDRAGQQYIRLSPHFYTTDAELQKLVEFL